MLTMILLVVGGAVLAAVVGTVWYSPATPMGRVHMAYLGFDKLSDEEKKAKMEAAKPMMPQMYGAQMLLSLLTSFFVVFVTTRTMMAGLPLSVALIQVAFAWLCLMVPVVGSSLLWGNCDRKIAWQKFFADIFCNLVTVVLIALLASFFV